MKDIFINRLKDETKMLRDRYTNWTDTWFPKKKKEYKMSEHHAEWFRIVSGVYDD